jgi:hypothetical protein
VPGTYLQIVHPPDQNSHLLRAWWSPLLPHTEFCNKKTSEHSLYLASLMTDSLFMTYIGSDIPDHSFELYPKLRYYPSIFPKDTEENHEKPQSG